MKCPNCSGTGISTKQITINRASGKRISWFIHLVPGGCASLIGALGIWATIKLAQDATKGGIDWGVLPGAVVFGVVGAFSVIRYLTADKVKLFKNECADCHHKWAEREAAGWSGVKCPNCSGCKVTTQTIAMDPKSGKPMSRFLHEVLGWLAILFGIATVVVAFILFWGDSGFFYLLATGVAFGLGGHQFVAKYNANQVHLNTCTECSHQWQEKK